MNSKWEWVDNHFGPMGWFSDADKKQYENTEEFAKGHWRPLEDKEIAGFKRWLGHLAHPETGNCLYITE